MKGEVEYVVSTVALAGSKVKSFSSGQMHYHGNDLLGETNLIVL
jgi:hypothetical protein